MVKSYIKYEQSHAFGAIYSGSSNIVWTPHDVTTGADAGAGVIFVGANESVLSWDMKKGQQLGQWKDSSINAEVTSLTKSPVDESLLAVGYADGSIRVWDSRIGSVLITFNGHKAAVTHLAFDRTGARLASGAKDTDIILWDLVGEVGMFKLRGHKDQITGIHFLYPSAAKPDEHGLDEGVMETDSEAYALLSTSKDALIKVWDLLSQHCIETHVAQTNGECWALGVSPDMTGCMTAGNEGELRIWSVDLNTLHGYLNGRTIDPEVHILHDLAVIYRQGKDRTLGVHFHPQSDYIAVHGSEKAVEVLRIRDDAEAKRVMARKRKRRREKAGDQVLDEEVTEEPETLTSGEVFVPHAIVRTSGKVRSFTWIKSKDRKKLQMIVGTSNNMVEQYSVTAKILAGKSKDSAVPDYNRISTLDLPGHRADIRALALSSDDRMLATASNGSLKIWNIQTRHCIRTLESGYGLCCAFIPGDRLTIVGNKDGELELFDIASSTLLDTIKAHNGAIWTLNVHPNGRSMATGSADKTVKFWNFEIKQEPVEGTDQTVPRFKLIHSRTLKINDDVLKIRFSPDSRLIAVATLDNTVKVFFLDSLKLFLNLYGHKLPVLDMSISSDSKLIATCSADKNVRLWGLDFGDCHKAFFAHNESVMQVAFIPHPISREDGHLFFSASKDRFVKNWDGDKFEQIQKLEGHHGEIWAMTISRTGDFLVTTAHDKSIRIWSQTDEPIFLEEEREREMEQLYESTLQAQLGDDDNNLEGGDDKVVAASKQTIQTLTAGEKIAEALELGIADHELVSRWKKQKAINPNIAPPPRDPLFMALGGISAEKHVLNTIAKIPASQLHDALLVLPFSMLPALFSFIALWLRLQWNVSLVCRILFFMLTTHQRQIVASRELRVILEGMRDDLRNTLGSMKDVMGFNLAALKFLSQKSKDSKLVRLEDAEKADETDNRRKRTFVDVA